MSLDKLKIKRASLSDEGLIKINTEQESFEEMAERILEKREHRSNSIVKKKSSNEGLIPKINWNDVALKSGISSEEDMSFDDTFWSGFNGNSSRTNGSKSPSKSNLSSSERMCRDGNIHPVEECFRCGQCGYDYWINDKDRVALDVIDGMPITIEYNKRITTHIEIKDGVFKETFGYTKPKYCAYFTIYMSKKYGKNGVILSINNIKGWDFEEGFSNGYLIDEGTKTKIPVRDVKFYFAFKNFHSLLPDSMLTDSYLAKIGEKSSTYLISEGIRLTYGVELELSRGYIGLDKAKELNISAMRDGSLNKGEGGLEIVTGVLTGDNGMMQLQKICNELSQRCLVDAYCGMHLHCGGIEFTDRFLVNLYVLALYLQDEIFSTLPPSRRGNQYCRELDTFDFKVHLVDGIELDNDYNRLFKYISYEKTNNPTFDYNKTKQHPMGPKCNYNHSTPRYCWLNFVPAMFDTRGGGEKSKSIEIRCHNGTTNFTKVKNWTLLFLAIIQFTDKHPQRIIKGIGINDILRQMYPKKCKQIIDYFEERKEKFGNPDFIESFEYKENLENLKSIKELI